MPCCTAPRCGHNSTTSRGITFHSYPLSRPHMVERWLECLQAQGKRKDWRPNHWSKVCGRHFEARYVTRNTQVRLTEDAVPTIFDPQKRPRVARGEPQPPRPPRELRPAPVPPQEVRLSNVAENLEDEEEETWLDEKDPLAPDQPEVLLEMKPPGPPGLIKIGGAPDGAGEEPVTVPKAVENIPLPPVTVPVRVAADRPSYSVAAILPFQCQVPPPPLPPVRLQEASLGQNLGQPFPVSNYNSGPINMTIADYPRYPSQNLSSKIEAMSSSRLGMAAQEIAVSGIPEPPFHTKVRQDLIRKLNIRETQGQSLSTEASRPPPIVPSPVQIPLDGMQTYGRQAGMNSGNSQYSRPPPNSPQYSRQGAAPPQQFSRNTGHYRASQPSPYSSIAHNSVIHGPTQRYAVPRVPPPPEPIREENPNARISAPAVYYTTIETNTRGANPAMRTAQTTSVPNTSQPMRAAQTNVPNTSQPMRAAQTSVPNTSQPMKGAQTNVPNTSQPIRGAQTNVPNTSQPMRAAQTNVPNPSQQMRGAQTNVPNTLQQKSVAAESFNKNTSGPTKPPHTQSPGRSEPALKKEGSKSLTQATEDDSESFFAKNIGQVPDETNRLNVMKTPTASAPNVSSSPRNQEAARRKQKDLSPWELWNLKMNQKKKSPTTSVLVSPGVKSILNVPNVVPPVIKSSPSVPNLVPSVVKSNPNPNISKKPIYLSDPRLNREKPAIKISIPSLNAKVSEVSSSPQTSSEKYGEDNSGDVTIIDEYPRGKNDAYSKVKAMERRPSIIHGSTSDEKLGNYTKTAPSLESSNVSDHQLTVNQSSQTNTSQGEKPVNTSRNIAASGGNREQKSPVIVQNSGASTPVKAPYQNEALKTLLLKVPATAAQFPKAAEVKKSSPDMSRNAARVLESCPQKIVTQDNSVQNLTKRVQPQQLSLLKISNIPPNQPLNKVSSTPTNLTSTSQSSSMHDVGKTVLHNEAPNLQTSQASASKSDFSISSRNTKQVQGLSKIVPNVTTVASKNSKPDGMLENSKSSIFPVLGNSVPFLNDSEPSSEKPANKTTQMTEDVSKVKNINILPKTIANNLPAMNSSPLCSSALSASSHRSEQGRPPPMRQAVLPSTPRPLEPPKVGQTQSNDGKLTVRHQAVLPSTPRPLEPPKLCQTKSNVGKINSPKQSFTLPCPESSPFCSPPQSVLAEFAKIGSPSHLSAAYALANLSQMSQKKSKVDAMQALNAATPVSNKEGEKTNDKVSAHTSYPQKSKEKQTESVPLVLFPHVTEKDPTISKDIEALCSTKPSVGAASVSGQEKKQSESSEPNSPGKKNSASQQKWVNSIRQNQKLRLPTSSKSKTIQQNVTEKNNKSFPLSRTKSMDSMPPRSTPPPLISDRHMLQMPAQQFLLEQLKRPTKVDDARQRARSVEPPSLLMDLSDLRKLQELLARQAVPSAEVQRREANVKRVSSPEPPRDPRSPRCQSVGAMRPRSRSTDSGHLRVPRPASAGAVTLAKVPSKKRDLDLQASKVVSKPASKDTLAVNKDTLTSKKDTITVKKDASTASKDTSTAKKDTLAANKDTLTAKKDTLTVNKDNSTANKEAAKGPTSAESLPKVVQSSGVKEHSVSTPGEPSKGSPPKENAAKSTSKEFRRKDRSPERVPLARVEVTERNLVCKRDFHKRLQVNPQGGKMSRCRSQPDLSRLGAEERPFMEQKKGSRGRDENTRSRPEESRKRRRSPSFDSDWEEKEKEERRKVERHRAILRRLDLEITMEDMPLSTRAHRYRTRSRSRPRNPSPPSPLPTKQSISEVVKTRPRSRAKSQPPVPRGNAHETSHEETSSEEVCETRRGRKKSEGRRARAKSQPPENRVTPQVAVSEVDTFSLSQQDMEIEPQEKFKTLKRVRSKSVCEPNRTKSMPLEDITVTAELENLPQGKRARSKSVSEPNRVRAKSTPPGDHTESLQIIARENEKAVKRPRTKSVSKPSRARAPPDDRVGATLEIDPGEIRVQPNPRGRPPKNKDAKQRQRSKSQPPLARHIEKAAVVATPPPVKVSQPRGRRKSIAEERPSPGKPRRQARSKSQPPDSRVSERALEKIVVRRNDQGLWTTSSCPTSPVAGQEEDQPLQAQLPGGAGKSGGVAKVSGRKRKRQDVDKSQPPRKKIRGSDWWGEVGPEPLLASLSYRLHCLLWLLLRLRRAGVEFSSPTVHAAGAGDAYLQLQGSHKLFLFPRLLARPVTYMELLLREPASEPLSLRNFYQTFKQILPDSDTRFVVHTSAELDTTLFELGLLSSRHDATLDTEVTFFKDEFEGREEVIRLLTNGEIIEEEIAKRFLQSLSFIEGPEDLKAEVMGHLLSEFPPAEAEAAYGRLHGWAQAWLANRTGSVLEVLDILAPCKEERGSGHFGFQYDASRRVAVRDAELLLMTGSLTARPLVVVGPPGVGKSELVRKMLHEQRLEHVVWLSNVGPALVSAAAFYGVRPGPSPAETLHGLCRALGDRSAVVLDDMTSPALLPAGLDEMVPLLIVTSRCEVWPGLSVVRLEPLAQEQACKLVADLIGLDAKLMAGEEGKMLSHLCSLAGGLPLSLQLVAMCVRAEAESLNVLGPSSAVSRSLRCCLARLRKHHDKPMPGQLCSGLQAVYQMARGTAQGQTHGATAGSMLELLACAGDTAAPLRAFLGVVSGREDEERREEGLLVLARAATLLATHGLLHIDAGVASLPHPLLGELTRQALGREGRQAHVLDLALNLAAQQTKLDKPEAVFAPRLRDLWGQVLRHLELVIKHHRVFLDFLDSSSEQEQVYAGYAATIASLGSERPRVLSAALWSRLRVARCQWDAGQVQAGEATYQAVLASLAPGLEQQDAFFMRAHRLVCRLPQLSDPEVTLEIEGLLTHSVPMSLGGEQRHIRYIRCLAEALGRVGRRYQAWALYQVVLEHRQGPELSQVVASAGALAWSNLPGPRALETLKSCLSETPGQPGLLLSFATWAAMLEGPEERLVAQDTFQRAVDHFAAQDASFAPSLVLWRQLGEAGLFPAALVVTETSLALPALQPWKEQVLLALRSVTQCALGGDSGRLSSDQLAPLLSQCRQLAEWPQLLALLARVLVERRRLALAAQVLERAWDLCTDPPTLDTVPRLPDILRGLRQIADQLLGCGRPLEAHQIFARLPHKVGFVVQNGGEAAADLLATLEANLAPSDDCGDVALRTELLKAELDRALDESERQEPVFPASGVRSPGEVLLEPEIWRHDPAEALRTCERALERRRGQEDAYTLSLLYHKACVVRSMGQLQEALQIASEVLNSLARLRGSSHPETLAVVFLRASILEEQLKLEEAQTAYEILYEKQAGSLGEEHPDTMTTRARIASVLECKGQTEMALEIFEELLVRQRTTLGIEHPATLATMFERAGLLQKQGRLQEACQAFEEVRNIRKEHLGPEHVDTLATVGRIASVVSCMLNYEQAHQMFEELLEKQREVLGSSHPATLTSLHNHAVVFEQELKFDMALNAFQHALALKIKTHGIKHPSTLLTMEAIARTLTKSGDLNNALDIYDSIISRNSESYSLETSVKLGRADVLEKLGRLKEAKALLEEVQTAQVRVLGEDHKSTLVTAERVAAVLSKQGEHGRALELYGDVVEKARLVFGPQHVSTRSAIHNMAVVQGQAGMFDEALSQLGELLTTEQSATKSLALREQIASLLECKCEYSKSQQLYEQVAQRRSELFGGDDPGTLATLSRLGAVLHKQGRNDEAAVILRDVKEQPQDCLAPLLYSSGHFARALALLEKNLKEKRARLGETHPSTLATLEGKAAALAGCELRDEALTVLHEVLLLRVQMTGEKDPSTLATRARIAVVLSEQELLVPALDMFEQVLATQKEMLGVNHPDTLATMQNRCCVLEMQGDFERALEASEELLQLRVTALGPENPETLQTEARVASLFERKGDLKAAVERYNAVLAKMQRSLGMNHPATLAAMFRQACALETSGELPMSHKTLEVLLPLYVDLLGSDHPTVLATKNRLVILQTKVGHGERALASLDDILAKQRPSEQAATLATRASILVQTDRLGEAVETYREIVKLLRADNGDKHALTLTTRNKMALVLLTHGDLDAALEILEEVASQQREVLGADHPSTLATLHNRAAALHRQARCPDAKRGLQEVLALGEARLGKYHHVVLASRQLLVAVLADGGLFKEALEMFAELPETARTVVALRARAVALEGLCRVDEATAAYEQVVSRQTRETGPEHPDTLSLKSRFASFLEASGEGARAGRLHDELLQVCRKRFGAEHATTLVISHNLAATQMKMSGRRREAASLLRRNLKAERASLGENHPTTLATRGCLALTQAQLGFGLTHAREELAAVLSAQTTALGGDHPDTLATRHNQATLMDLQGDHKGALHEFQQVLVLRRSRLGADDAASLATEARVANTLERLGRGREAEGKFEEVLRRQRAMLGSGHPDTLATMHAQTHALERRGMHKKALAVCQELLKLEESHPQGREEEGLTALHHAVWLLEKLGRLEEAARHCEQLWERRIALLGETDSATLAARAHLASIYAAQNKLDKAVSIYREVLRQQEQMLGDSHPQTLVSLHNLAWALQRQKSSGREVQRLAGTLRQRRQNTQRQRQSRQLLTACVVRETARMEDMLEKSSGSGGLSHLIPHIPL